eukprot:152252_1
MTTAQNIDMQNMEMSTFNRSDHNADWTKCDIINRIMKAMKFIETVNDAKKQTEFISETWTQLLNDRIHLIKIHHDDIDRISEHMPPCNFNECSYTTRHYGYSPQHNIADPSEIFNKRVVDGLHFYLHHLTDVGLRINHHEHYISDEKKQETDCYDAKFAMKNKLISQKSVTTNKIPRFLSENKKFTIVIDDNYNQSTGEQMTMIDKCIAYITAKRNVKLTGFKEFLREEEYDTDAIMFAAEIDDYNDITYSNDFQWVQKRIKCSKTTFDVGIRFYYWPHYKSITENTDNKTEIWNVYDHGYPICDLYVENKYQNFKEEIYQYETFAVSRYPELQIKVHSFMDTPTAKRMSCAPAPSERLYYGIQAKQTVSSHHLLSALLYTDYSYVSTDFSASFRANDIFESISAIKERNSQFWWMSKNLREFVELFGDSSCGLYDTESNAFIRQMVGPFFCGLSGAFKLEQFTMRLCSPTSTSSVIEVALKFRGSDGIIIEFNNPKTTYHANLRGVDCSWFSTFTGEDERLFIGGQYPIAVTSVKVGNENFEDFIRVYYILDTGLSGGFQYMSNFGLSNSELNMINVIIMDVMGIKKSNYNEYAVQTFNLMRYAKKQIVLSLEPINRDESVKHLMMDKMEKRNHQEEKMRQHNDNTNLFRKDLLQIFPNVETLTISTTSAVGRTSYSISLMSLLSLIKTSALQKVIVKADSERVTKYNWIDKLWVSKHVALQKTFIKQGYIICQRIVEKETKILEYWLVIKIMTDD